MLVKTISSPGALSTSFSIQSPSLMAEEGFRQRPTITLNNKEDENEEPSDEIPRSPYYPCDIKPYIGLRAKLSLAWITYPIVALFIVVVRLLKAMGSIQPLVDDVKSKAIESCNALELATSTVTSLPHYMANGFNKANVEVINLTIKGFTNSLQLSLTALEGIISWFIQTYLGTYLCLLKLVTNASMSVMFESIKVLQSFATDQIGIIKTNIDKEIIDINEVLKKIQSDIEKIPKTENIHIPVIAVNSANPLSTFQLPSKNIITGLDSLNETLNSPNNSITGIKSKLNDLISIPFDKLRTEIQNKLSDLKFNESVLPQPQKNNITFCQQSLDLTFLDNLTNDLIKAAYIGITIIIIVGILMIIGNAIITWISHRKFKRIINKFDSEEYSDFFSSFGKKEFNKESNKETMMTIIKSVEYPFISFQILKTSKYFKKLENRNLYRWFWDYILHRSAIVILIIGLAGVLGIYIQLWILQTVRNDYQQVTKDFVTSFGNSVMDLVNSQMNSTSQKYSSESNLIISNFENNVNDNVFGWANITTNTLNDTINTAVDEITGLVNNVFGGIPLLATSIQELLNCLILTKIKIVQKVLTFIQDNASLGLPRVSNDKLLVSSNLIKGFVDEATTKLVGDNESGGISTGGDIGHLFDIYEKNLRDELFIFWIMIKFINAKEGKKEEKGKEEGITKIKKIINSIKKSMTIILRKMKSINFGSIKKIKKRKMNSRKLSRERNNNTRNDNNNYDNNEDNTNYNENNQNDNDNYYNYNEEDNNNPFRDINSIDNENDPFRDIYNINNDPFSDNNSINNNDKPLLPPKPLYLRK
ncbi:9795_t:CDS:2 [Diversispora eburnea]|uniref:Plasma membrane fusion protein PRM1 n=1 Tax=Diversispora eburnea TaxID=1213867 RepID=A0A9N8YRW4_9GLOM|nr:9795_t:CDS:2 [Diversispora eburnea]